MSLIPAAVPTDMVLQSFWPDSRKLLGRILFWSFLSGLLLHSGGLFAQTGRFGQVEQASAQQSNNPLAQLTLEQLGNIEVTTASKEPEQVWRTPAAIYVITQDDIRRSGATTIADALRLAPGVEVGRISSTTWAVGVRGFQSDFSKAVLVLIDGRSVYTPFFAGVFWDVQDLPLQDIDRIEVIRGPGATIWGPNAVNGVINIITKKATDTQGPMLSLLGGNFEQGLAQAQYGGAIGRNFTYRVYGKGFIRGPEYHTDHDNFDTWHQARGGFRMDWDSGGRNSYLLEGDAYRGDSPHRIGVTDVDDSVSGGNLLARWRRELGDGSDLYLQMYFDRTTRTGSQLGETRNTFDLDFLHHLKLGEKNDFSWGGGLRWSPSHFVQTQPTIDLQPHDLLEHIYSGFVQDEIGLPANLSLTLGTKLEHNNFSGFDAQPTARLLWTPRPNQSFWAAVTRAVTTPSRLEEGFRLTGIISANPLILLRVSGSPNFKSESLIGYEGGYRQLLRPSLYVDLAVFHNNYSDLQSFSAPVSSLQAVPPFGAVPVLTIFYANDLAGSTDGFEIAPSWTPVSWWRGKASYSFVTADLHANAPTSDISSTGSVRTDEGSTPRHQVHIHSAFSVANFEFDQDYRYASELPAQRVKAYQTMDLRFGWNASPHLEISVVGQNLLQPFHFEWGTGDPTQPLIGIRRGGYLQLTFR